jgi:hypothetical protein
MTDSKPSHTTMMLLHKINRGGVVDDAQLACDIGTLLCKQHYGLPEATRQQPLKATDQGDSWRVEGIWNREYKLNDTGPFFMTIKKFDGQITDLGLWGPRLKGPPQAVD